MSDMSTDGSRSVRNAVVIPGRSDSWVTCPSTHTAPSLFTQEVIAWAITRTGAGFSGEVSSGTAPR